MLRKIVLGLAFFGMLHFSYAQSECISGDCNNGEGVIHYSDGGKYSGQFKNTYRHGVGYYKFKSGDVYAGDWVNGKTHGEGTYIFANGDIYFGSFRDGKRNGMGRYIYAKNGSELSGIWENSKFVGRKTTINNNSSIVANKTRNASNSNKGLKSSSGVGVDYLKAEILIDRKEDSPWYMQAVLRLHFEKTENFTGTNNGINNLRLYDETGGLFALVLPQASTVRSWSNSESRMTSADWFTYNQAIRNNRIRNKFQIDFRLGFRDFSKIRKVNLRQLNCEGMGCWNINDLKLPVLSDSDRRYLNTKIQKSENRNESWNEFKRESDKISSITGKPVSNFNEEKLLYLLKSEEERLKFHNAEIKRSGSSCTGNCSNGYGIMNFTNGGQYAGYWKNGKAHGQGIDYYKNGDKYVGSFENNQRSGQGTYYYSNGKKYQGNWKNGKQHGDGTYYDKNGKWYERGVYRDGKLDKNAGTWQIRQ